MASRLSSFFRKTLCLVSLLAVTGAGCTKGPDAATTNASKKQTLKVWAVIDDEDVYEPILTDYHRLHPYLDIEFRRFRLEEYEKELLNAMAEDEGPDVFLIHNTWVGKYLSKILPMPASTKVAVQTVQGTVKKEVVYTLQTDKTVSLATYKKEYPEVVAKDFIRNMNVSKTADVRTMEDRVVAMPMSVDTMALYVNQDLLNAAGVATIPDSWDTFMDAVRKLAKQDENGNIVQAGAAMGTGFNVERSPDLLSLLMMQNRTEMTRADGQPSFTAVPAALSDAVDEPPAFRALNFYTDFANPGRDVYTWNNKMPNSLDAFVQGKTAFFFGYNYHLPIIKARGPRINLAISKMPQIPGFPTVNYASYWGWTVSKKSKSPDIAWNFLNFMRMPEENKKYLDLAKRPAALRAQIADQLENEDIGVFASQVLTSRSWYRGNDPDAMDNAFIVLIEDALQLGPERYSQIMNIAADKISQTITY